MGIILGDFNFCEPEEGRFNVWNQTFTDGDTGKAALFHSLFPHVFENAQTDHTRRDSSVVGIKLTLSRIDRILINLPENLGRRSIPSDHAAVCIVIQNRPGTTGQTSRVGCQNIPSVLERRHDGHGYSADPARSQISKLSLKRPIGRLFVTSHARHLEQGYRPPLLRYELTENRHLGTLMRCCEAWEPVGTCFDPISFECTDFEGLSQIIASLTRESLAEREAETWNLPWTQTEKDNALAKCRLGLRAFACQETDALSPRRH